MLQDRTIAVLGATGAQGGGVVQALQEQGVFSVRALTRHPESTEITADEVVGADLDDAEGLAEAFDGAYGVFATVNSFASTDTDELGQGRRSVEAARSAGITHYVWSTLPDVSAISDGRFSVPHFTNKATIDGFVENAGFTYSTFVEAPFYYQNLLTPWYQPKPGLDGTPTLTQPMAADARCIHMGDITELGYVAAGAFANPGVAGSGQHLALAGDLLSWNDLITVLRDLGHEISYAEDSDDPWGIRDMLSYFTEFTYFGPAAEAKIAAAAAVATKPSTDFRTWAKANMAV